MARNLWNFSGYVKYIVPSAAVAYGVYTGIIPACNLNIPGDLHAFSFKKLDKLPLAKDDQNLSIMSLWKKNVNNNFIIELLTQEINKMQELECDVSTLKEMDDVINLNRLQIKKLKITGTTKLCAEDFKLITKLEHLVHLILDDKNIELISNNYRIKTQELECDIDTLKEIDKIVDLHKLQIKKLKITSTKNLCAEDFNLIMKLEHLNHLILDNNDIEMIPDKFQDYIASHIKILSLNNCKLISNPLISRQCIYLEELCLSNNSLQSFNILYGQYFQLVKLDLSNNKIMNFTIDSKYFPKLEYCDLANNIINKFEINNVIISELRLENNMFLNFYPPTVRCPIIEGSKIYLSKTANYDLLFGRFDYTVTEIDDNTICLTTTGRDKYSKTFLWDLFATS